MTNIVEIFSNIQGTDFVGIDTETEVKLTGGKKNPMQGRVTKVTKGSNVMVFQNGGGYGAMVQRRLEQEGKDPASFELSERRWGTRVQGGPFVEHKGSLYLEVIFLKAGEVSYLLDGQPIAKEDIEGLPASRGEAEQGGLENKVVIRTFKVDSIVAMRVNKQEFTNITQ